MNRHLWKVEKTIYICCEPFVLIENVIAVLNMLAWFFGVSYDDFVIYEPCLDTQFLRLHQTLLLNLQP